MRRMAVWSACSALLNLEVHDANARRSAPDHSSLGATIPSLAWLYRCLFLGYSFCHNQCEIMPCHETTESKMQSCLSDDKVFYWKAQLTQTCFDVQRRSSLGARLASEWGMKACPEAYQLGLLKETCFAMESPDETWHWIVLPLCLRLGRTNFAKLDDAAAGWIETEQEGEMCLGD